MDVAYVRLTIPAGTVEALFVMTHGHGRHRTSGMAIHRVYQRPWLMSYRKQVDMSFLSQE